MGPSLEQIVFSVVILTCLCLGLLSFRQTMQRTDLDPSRMRVQELALDAWTATRLRRLPEEMEAVENSIVQLEASIQQAASISQAVTRAGFIVPAPYLSDWRPALSPSIPSQEVLDPVPSPPAPSGLAASPPASPASPPSPEAARQKAPAVVNTSVTGVIFRSDYKCGKMTPKLSNGEAVGCDGAGGFFCCSDLGWCGSSGNHCDCRHCRDYRPSNASPYGAGKVNATVAVIIPFRDREGHLVLFKKFWRVFAQTGFSPQKVKRWEIYIVEQFDGMTFNRGWNFNVGFAVATAIPKASKEITSGMRIGLDCAVIQDIDYLPEPGVDYSECSSPTQLSAEIDRYNWKTPYLESAGGIVSMKEEHWQKINGFSNEYFGWGGEDDELHHRLRINELLKGDCYPFCSVTDSREGKVGISIRRPPKGHGRFSGEYMHSANHTKRITDAGAYDKNLKLLQEIRNSDPRWKDDGLSNLNFRILDYQIDKADFEEFGITYHHVKIHRGVEDYNLSAIPLVVPETLCPGLAGSKERFAIGELGRKTPFDMGSLRHLAHKLVESNFEVDGAACKAPTSFILVDLRRSAAKIFAEDSPQYDPRLLISFLRSLTNPEIDGLIIADPRPSAVLRKAFNDTGALFVPIVEHSICTSPLKVDGPKYSVHHSASCAHGGWHKVERGFFNAYLKPRPGFIAVSYCDTTKHWTQHIVLGKNCEDSANWADLRWVFGGTFYVPPGDDFCVGSRDRGAKESSFSRMLPQSNCDGDGFTHDFSFGQLVEQSTLVTGNFCIGQSGVGTTDTRIRVSAISQECSENGLTRVANFLAHVSSSIRPTLQPSKDRSICVSQRSTSDEIFEGACNKSGDSDRPSLSLHVPGGEDEENILLGANPVLLAEARRRDSVCFGGREVNFSVSVGKSCDLGRGRGSFRLQRPSLLNIVLSTPREQEHFLRGIDGNRSTYTKRTQVLPLYTLVEEERECFGFLCPVFASGLW